MNTKKEHGKIDWMITLVPLAIVIALCVLFFLASEQSNAVLSQIRFFLGDTFGTVDIRLPNPEYFPSLSDADQLHTTPIPKTNRTEYLLQDHR